MEFLLWVVFVNRANRANSHDNFTPKMMSHIWPTNVSFVKGFFSVYIWSSRLMWAMIMPFLSFQISWSDAQWRVKHSSDKALGTVNCSGPPLTDNSVQRWWWSLWVNPGVEIVVWALVVCRGSWIGCLWHYCKMKARLIGNLPVLNSSLTRSTQVVAASTLSSLSYPRLLCKSSVHHPTGFLRHFITTSLLQSLLQGRTYKSTSVVAMASNFQPELARQPPAQPLPQATNGGKVQTHFSAHEAKKIAYKGLT